jgi:hypothetical protein
MKYVVVVRGRLKGSKAEAQAVHDATVGKISPQSRQMGSTGHQAYLNTQDPKDFLAVDSWDKSKPSRSTATRRCRARQAVDGQPE